MRPADCGQILGELFNRGVGHPGRTDVLSECAGNVQSHKMFPPGRVIEIFYAQVAVVVEVLGQTFVVERTKHRRAERAYCLRTERSRCRLRRTSEILAYSLECSMKECSSRCNYLE